MQTTKVNIRGVAVDNVDLDEALARVIELSQQDGVHAVYTPNAEIMQACMQSDSLCALFNRAELVLPDGAGVVLAAKILGTPLKAKTPGYDLGLAVADYAAKNSVPVYFLGGKHGVAQAAAEKLQARYKGLQIVGCHDGYFEKTGAVSDAVCKEIADSGAVFLYVCLGFPAQELWIDANRKALGSVTVAMGLGGSFDGYAGLVKRAPRLMIHLRLEWFWRLLHQPSRIGRMVNLPKFILGTLFSKKSG